MSFSTIVNQRSLFEMSIDYYQSLLKNCQNFEFPKGTSIVIYEIFELDVPCNDEVVIYNGEHETDPVILRACGQYSDLSDVEKRGKTTRHRMLIKFVSDDLLWGHGFQLEYRLQPSQGKRSKI